MNIVMNITSLPLLTALKELTLSNEQYQALSDEHLSEFTGVWCVVCLCAWVHGCLCVSCCMLVRVLCAFVLCVVCS